MIFDDERVVRLDKTFTIGGLIRVKAESTEEAIEFAKGCPALQGEGNTILMLYDRLL